MIGILRKRTVKLICWTSLAVLVTLSVVITWGSLAIYVNNVKGVTSTSNITTRSQQQLDKLRPTVPPVNTVNASNSPSYLTTRPGWHSEQLPDSRPQTHLGFLKVHKAASTTTQAIFLRFGWKRNLTFALPPEFNPFGYPNIISLNESVTSYNILPPPPDSSFSILCHHVVYKKAAWDRVLPTDSAIIGTVREPYTLFKSICNYFYPIAIRFIKADDKVGEFLRNPARYDLQPIPYSVLNNRMAFEYGVDPDIIKNRQFDSFNSYLNDVLDKEFDLVIVAERFDESLVLMKRMLRWRLNDIMYAKKNVRSSKSKDKFHHKVEHKPLHRNYSTFDYMIYEFFTDKLNRQIEAEGPNFLAEVKHFKETRAFIEQFCHNVPQSIKSITIAKSIWNEEFDITRNDCSILHTEEIIFTQNIRKRQYGNATWPDKN